MTQLNLVGYGLLMTTSCNTETVTFFDGSSTLFGWLGLVEPSDSILTEADLAVDVEDAEEAEREERAESQWRRELENGWF